MDISSELFKACLGLSQSEVTVRQLDKSNPKSLLKL